MFPPVVNASPGPLTSLVLTHNYGGHNPFLTAPPFPSPPCLSSCSGLLPNKPWGCSSPFTSLTPSHHPFLCSLHLSSSQGHPQSCPITVLGCPSARVPVSVPSPRSSATQCRWPPVHPSSSASRDTRLLGAPPFGVPFPRGTHQVPLPGLFGDNSGLAHCLPCTCCPPCSGSAPLPQCPAQGGSLG